MTRVDTPDARQAAADRLASVRVGFAGNAVSGMGGQGEFLRQMVFALDGLPHAIVYSRHANTAGARSVDLPFSASAGRMAFDAIRRTPMLRRRRDWLTLLNDLDFDRLLSAAAVDVDLLDAVSGQCAATFRRLERTQTRRVLTSLNTHIDYLAETLEAEHQRLGFREQTFIHARMRERALREVELAHVVRVNSRWAMSTFVDRGVPAEKVRVVHPAIDRARFYPVEKVDDVFRVVAVSTIEPRKGILYLLQAFEGARLPNAELLIIGGTGDRWSSRMLETFQRRNPNIRHRALDVTSAPLTESYGAASVVVHPALEDGYGLVIAQALATGRPVIATRQSGASELIENGRHGFVVERGSVDAIREHLELLAHDRPLLDRMSAWAPEAVAELGYDRFAAQVRSLYEQALS